MLGRETATACFNLP